MNPFIKPAVLLRGEDAFLLAAALFAYGHLHLSWVLFAVLFLAPDLLMVGYLLNVRAGATLYNVGHVLFLPLLVLGAGYVTGCMEMVAVGLIWFSHIELDRMLGFGLKYPTTFKDTHLQHLDLIADAVG
ncbi:protein of unknown function [Bryocella elongata]|uniref:DUF4260 family protein n=1 Tax=Bryocella elongata TaxID=863522 RepID=A0A1H6B2Q1_9BACT|nr:DUF4260 domain-containing protein [Bryocella elongata]SEG55119.1 protein of unknown function [Bryocella elongata]